MTKRIRIVALWILGILLGLPVLLVAAILVLANIDAGRSLIASETSKLTGGMVTITGLSGRFPDALRIAHIGISDANGVWLSIDDARLDWSPLALIHRTASIQTLSATNLSLPRLPAPSKAPPPKQQSGGFSLPVKIELARLDIAHATIGALVAGRLAVLHVSGTANVASLSRGTATIAIDRLDSPGTYHLSGTIDANAIAARITASEPPGGFAGSLAHLPDLGGLTLDASVDGPRSAETTKLALSAGPLRLGAAGLIDLQGHTLTLQVTGSAPAMSPRPDVSWQSIALNADVHGSFTKPDVAAHASIASLAAGGAHVASLTLDAGGNQGAVDAHLVMAGVTLPPPKPDILAGGPLDLVAHIDLDQPTRPLRFKLTQALVDADGTAQTAGAIAGRLHLVVPDIAPLVAMGNVDLHGRTEAVATVALNGDNTDVTVDGTTGFTSGQAPVPTLLGNTTFGVSARLNGQDFYVTRADVQGRALKASVTGSDLAGKLALDWKLALTDLAAAAPAVVGALQASGKVQGPQTSLTVDADIAGDVGTRQIRKGPIKLALHAEGLPGTPLGTIDAKGEFDGAPATVQADLQRSADGAMHALLKHLDWKSLVADANLALASGSKTPTGRVTLRMSRLADLAPLIGQPVSGGVTASIDSAAAGARPIVKIAVAGNDIALGVNRVAKLTLAGQVTDPASQPVVSLALAATGLAAGAITGDAHATVRGPQSALAVQADAQLHNVAGGEASFATSVALDATRKSAVLSRLNADAHGESLRLVAPARIDFGSTVAVDRLRLALGQATLDIAGKISPVLALTADVRNVTPALAKPFVPDLNAAGVLTASARLTGTTSKPQGSIRISAQGLRVRTGPAASIPAANALVTILLQGQAASVNAHASAGPKLDASITGTAPLGAGALALQTRARIDLTLLDPILGATGQRTEGLLSVNGTVTGTTAKPTLGGRLTLAGGEVQDFVQGVRVQNIAADIEASGDSVRIASFTGHAGDGTIAASGSLGLAAPGMPIDLHITADHAKPISSDRLTTTLDASIAVTGKVAETMLVAGRVFLRRTDINIPNAFPASVAKLNVIRPGQKPPSASSAPSSVVRLDLTIDSPQSIFVRGHGLDAELGGKLTIGGTTAGPDIAGGFALRRGDFSLAGTTLQFSKGEVSFNGSGVGHAIDPTLDFEADSTNGGITATLAITGYADAPKITLSSVPALPQDEVLAHLLFGTSVSSLSPIQIAEIASAVAELSGVGGGGNPLNAVRNSLGLDRLDVSGGSGTTGATVAAGRYVARGVYVGAKQATGGGGGTVAQVQVDITKHLKATGQVGTGGGSVQGATPENDTGSTIGLSYRFEY